MDRQYTRRFNQLRAHIDEMLGNGAIITERAPLMIKSGEVRRLQELSATRLLD